MVYELAQGMRDFPGLGVEPMSLALTGEFFTTQPQGKPQNFIIKQFKVDCNTHEWFIRIFCASPNFVSIDRFGRSLRNFDEVTWQLL